MILKEGAPKCAQIAYMSKIQDGNSLPFLKIGATLACVHSVGEELVVYVILVLGGLGTLKYNSFRWRSIRMFNRLPKSICMLSSWSIVGFKSKLESYLRNIVDLPCRIQ